MMQFLKKYKAFFIGLIIIVPIFYLLDYIGFIIIPENQSYELIIYIIFWAVVIALPIHNDHYLQRMKNLHI